MNKMKSLKQKLIELEEQFSELYSQGCRTSIVMGNLKSKIGGLRIQVAELELNELKENYTPMSVTYNQI